MKAIIIIDDNELIVEFEPIYNPLLEAELWLAAPEHVNLTRSISFDRSNSCHVRYLERGLLYTNKLHAVLASRQMINLKPYEFQTSEAE